MANERPKKGKYEPKKGEAPQGPDIHALAQVLFEILLARAGMKASDYEPRRPPDEWERGQAEST